MTPQLFWKHHKRLVSTNRERLAKLVIHLVKQESVAPTSDLWDPLAHPTPIAKTGGRLLLCSLKDLQSLPSTYGQNVLYVILTPSEGQENTPSRTYIHAVSGKRGQAHFLNHVLPTSIDIIYKSIFKGFDVCVACETGRDLSVGVVTVALQLCFNDDGSFRFSKENSSEADAEDTLLSTE